MCGPPTQSPLVYHTGIQPSRGAGAMLQSLHSNVLHYNQKHLAQGLEWSQHYSINGQTAPHRGPIIVGRESISAFFLLHCFTIVVWHKNQGQTSLQYRLYEHNFTKRRAVLCWLTRVWHGLSAWSDFQHLHESVSHLQHTHT